MNVHSMLAALLLGGAVFLPNALGQVVYRCGNVYSQAPCPGGTAVDVQDTRTPQQKAQAESVAAEAAYQAEKLHNERMAQEKAMAGKAQTKPAKATSAKPGKPADATKKQAQSKKKGPEYFTAAAGSATKKDRTDKKPTDKAQPASTGKTVKP